MAKIKTVRRTLVSKRAQKSAKPRSTAASQVKVTGTPPKKKSLDKARKKVSAKARQVLKDSGKEPRGPRKVGFTDDTGPKQAGGDTRTGYGRGKSPKIGDMSLGSVVRGLACLGKDPQEIRKLIDKQGGDQMKQRQLAIQVRLSKEKPVKLTEAARKLLKVRA